MTSPTSRVPAYPVEQLLVERWSPRAFDGSPITDDQLMTLLEAARWAPSAYNVQPWRFLYARRDTADWAKFLDVLVPFNQSWAKHGALLLVVVSDTLMPGAPGDAPKPSHTHSFDAGSAWVQLALQATAMGLAAHGMSGVDFDKARTMLGVPDRFRIEMAIVVGKQGDASILPEGLQAREAPSDRKPIAEFAFEGGYPAA